MKAAYNFADFTDACAIGEKSVQVIKGAEQTAREHFNLKAKSEILGFIANGGLENPEYIKTKQWKNDPNNSGIMVDSYKFKSGSITGYTAYMYQPITKKWLLKSFKKFNTPGAPKNLAFDGLRKMLEDKGASNE